MTYYEWLQQANLTEFKNNIITTLRNYKFSNTDLNDALLESVMGQVKYRYGHRSILTPNALQFTGFYLNRLIHALPPFISRIKKYDEWADFVNKQNFGDTTTSESQGNNTSENRVNNSNTTTSNDTRNTTDTSKTIGTNTDTSESNGTNTSTNINLEGVTPDVTGTMNTLDTNIEGYGKGVTKSDGTNTDRSSNSSNSTNTTNNTSNSTNTNNSTSQDTNTSNTTSTSTNTNTSKRLNIQESIKMILDSDGQWGLGLEEFLASLEDLFVGATYYAIR